MQWFFSRHKITPWDIYSTLWLVSVDSILGLPWFVVKPFVKVRALGQDQTCYLCSLAELLCPHCLQLCLYTILSNFVNRIRHISVHICQYQIYSINLKKSAAKEKNNFPGIEIIFYSLFKSTNTSFCLKMISHTKKARLICVWALVLDNAFLKPVRKSEFFWLYHVQKKSRVVNGCGTLNEKNRKKFLT